MCIDWYGKSAANGHADGSTEFAVSAMVRPVRPSATVGTRTVQPRPEHPTFTRFPLEPAPPSDGTGHGRGKSRAVREPMT